MSEDTLCITCGSPVRIEGRTTMYYVPINAHDRSYIKALIAKEKAEKLLAFYKREAEAAFEFYNQLGNIGYHPSIVDPYDKARANRIALEET